MKKKNLLILSITALSTMVLGACDSTSSVINTTSIAQTTSEETTSETTSEEISTSEVTSEETSTTEVTSEEESSSIVEESYNIAVLSNDKAVISVDKAEAKAGETITVTVESIVEDNVLVKIEVLGANVGEVSVQEEVDQTFTFTMPEEDVTIEAITRELQVNSVSYLGDEDIAIAGEESVKEGETVSVSVEFSEGYSLESIQAESGEENVELTKVSPVEYTFIMPAGSVEVTASSTEAELNKYSNTIYRGSINYDDQTSFGFQVDYQMTFNVNTLTINSADNAGEYTGVVFENAPYFYDEDLSTVLAYTDKETYVFAEDIEGNLTFTAGFEVSYYPIDDSSSFTVYYSRSSVYTNVDFELKLSYPTVDATNPIQGSEYTFGVEVKDSKASDYMVGNVKVIKHGDESVEVPVVDNGDGTYTLTVPEFDIEIQAEAVELIDLVGHKYSASSYYFDSWTGDTVTFSMEVELFDAGVASFKYSSDIYSDEISTTNAAYTVDSANRTLSVSADGEDFEFVFVNEDDINRIELTSNFLELDSVKLSDRKFSVSLEDDTYVSLDLTSNTTAFQNEEKEFTLSFEEGYQFESISAENESGLEVSLTAVEEGVSYKVVMPYSNVTISVVTSAIPVEDTPVLGLKYTAEVDGYTDYVDYDTSLYEECTYEVSFDFISNTEVTIKAESTSGFLYGTPDSVDETVAYEYDSSTQTITVDGDSSDTLTYNEDGSLTCNYKLTSNIEGTRNAVFVAPVVIPVSGNSYAGSAWGTDDDWASCSYDCVFDFISDTQVNITIEIDSWGTGAEMDETYSYSYDSATSTITIDGDSSKTLTINEDGSLTCNYAVDEENYVNFSGENFALEN